MHKTLRDIPDRIVQNALGALTQANTQAVFFDPGMEHRDDLCILSAALAGELFLKAIVAKQHPLLIFKDLFHLDQPNNAIFSIEEVITSGRTYSFEHLPKLLWVAVGQRLPDMKSFEEVRVARNAVQHFCSPLGYDLRDISLRFIYNNIDPLIKKHLGLYAIEYHEDHVGYDYVVSCLVGRELRFSIPPDFDVREIDLNKYIDETSAKYRKGFGARLRTALDAVPDRREGR